MVLIFNIYFIGIIIIIFIFIQHVRKRKLHPPGPLGLPYVGLLPFQVIQIIFSKYLPKLSQQKMFRQMKEKYGDYWSMEMGGQRIVTLASFDVLNEAFVTNGQYFEGRPSNDVFDILSERKGIILVDGKPYKANRQVAVKALRELGMGKKELENQISDEANLLIEHMSKNTSLPMYSGVTFIKTISNIISRLAFNEFNKYGDPLFERFVKNIDIALMSDVIDTKCSLFPKFFKTKLARFLFPDVDEFFNAWAELKIFVANKCRKARSIQNEKGYPNCIFDYFWRYRFEDKQNISDEKKMDEIAHVLADLYTAGIETSNTLITFSCLMLGRYPDVQNDLRNEIQSLTDDYRLINMDLRKDCPKFLSFIDEIQRFCVLVPRFVRRMMKAYKFRGYQLYPEDIVFGDWGTISRDKTLFQNPEVFDPYRFMDKSRTHYIANKCVIPFGHGRRACIGESITNLEAFLIISRIILAFNISLPNETLNNFENILEGKSGLAHAPLEHKIKFDDFLPV